MGCIRFSCAEMSAHMKAGLISLTFALKLFLAFEFKMMTEQQAAENSSSWAKNRVAQLEIQMAESLTLQNKEFSELHCQIAKLLRHLEEGEAEKVSLESSLASTQQQSQRKEVEWEKLKTSMQESLNVMSGKCHGWQRTLEVLQQARAKERQILSSKEELLLTKRKQLEELTEANEQLQFELANEKSEVAGLKKRISTQDQELRGREMAVQQRHEDLMASIEREKNLEQELQIVIQRADSLEASLNQERGLLKKMQLNHDLNQHQVKELQIQLEEERKARQKCASNLRSLQETMTNLQSSLEEEIKKSEYLKEQLLKKSDESRGLVEQCCKKQQLVSDLTEQYHSLQIDSNALKEELRETQQKLSMMEDRWKDTVSVITEFQADLSRKKGTNKEENRDGVGNSTPNPTLFSDKLRLLLLTYQSMCEVQSEELSAVKSELASMKSELEQSASKCATRGEIIAMKTSALTEAEEKLKSSTDELSWHRAQLLKSQEKVQSLRVEIKSLQVGNKHVTSQHTATKSKLTSLQRKLATVNNVHCKFLQALLEDFTAIGDSNSNDVQIETNWTKLSETIKESVSSLIQSFLQARKESECCKLVIGKQRSLIETLERLHEESEGKITAAKWRGMEEKPWNSHVDSDERHASTHDEMKKHIYQSLDELKCSQIQLKKTNKRLRSELTRLKQVCKVYKNDRACLLSCVCLLVGNIFPILSQIQQLCFQKCLLKQMRTTTLSSTQIPTQSSAILRFRRVIIVVLAINRLIRLKNGSTQLFKTVISPAEINQSNFVSTSVHLGLKSRHLTTLSQISARDILQWMRSEHVLLAVRKLFSTLQSTLDRCTLDEKDFQSGTYSKRQIIDHLKLSLKECHGNFMKRMNSYFNPLELGFDTQFGLHSSLWCQLGNGLKIALKKVET